jgi:hypothetical protein
MRDKDSVSFQDSGVSIEREQIESKTRGIG